MIDVRIGELAETSAAALLRPVAADWSAVTAASRRVELAAGPAVEEQCRRLGELPVGSAAITAAGALPAQYIVHVVVRSAEQPVTAAIVRLGLVNGIRRLAEWGIESVAMSPLGTGAGNLDVDEAAELTAPLLHEQRAHAPRLKDVIIVVENDYERDAFQRALRRHAAPDPHGATSAQS